jgi:hypothetical protein
MKLWFDLFGAAVAWSLQELIAYGVISHACYPDWRPRSLVVPAGTWRLALVILAITAALGAFGAAAAWRAWRKTASVSSDAYDFRTAEDRVRFMALGGVALSGMVLFAVLLNLLSFLFLPLC